MRRTSLTTLLVLAFALVVSAMIAGPPARWMAPSTPPPPRRPLLAALTIASTAIRVMSPWTSRIRGSAGTVVSPRPGP